jgi:hypothetical protein
VEDGGFLLDGQGGKSSIDFQRGLDEGIGAEFGDEALEGLGKVASVAGGTKIENVSPEVEDGIAELVDERFICAAARAGSRSMSSTAPSSVRPTA